MNLITGANGLIGSYLCRYLLQQGEKIRAIKRKNSDLSLVEDIKNAIDWVDADITDILSLEDAMHGVEKIYHAAGFISYAKNQRNNLLRINAEATANVVNVAMDKGIKKILYVSSIAAIGKNVNNNIVTEENKWEGNKNISDYSLSKFLGEKEVWRGIAEGLNAVIINPSIVVGAGNWNQGPCKLFTTVNNGFKFYTEGTTGYVDVRDVVKIAYQLMNSSITSERFILNSENIIFRDYFFMIADAIDKKRPGIKANKFLSSLAWRAEAVKYFLTGKEPSVTKQTAKIANSTYYYDNSKIMKALNYQFTPIEYTIQESAKYFKLYLQTGKFGHLDF
ncbi:MAG: NAD-dependent epimerase/dehydratase family protein [Fimbriimonadaceae bacterium]|nr:NAD-dependent epimerase/dehydratase family protein [Chitinophagales bacterium]